MAIQFVTDQIKNDAITADKIELDTGTYAFANAATLTWGKVPAADAELANKAYVDSIASGLDLKESCLVATTAPITLSGTQTIDGVAVTATKRVLVKDQGAGADNGIYVCAAGAWARSSDFAAGDSESGAFTFVTQGTVNGDAGFVCTNNEGSDVVGTDVLVFSQFSGAGQITAGDGLTKTGNTLSVNVDDSSLTISGDALLVKASGITDNMLAGSISNGKLANSSVALGGVSIALGGTDTTPAFNLSDATAYPTSSLVGTITNAQLAGSIADTNLLTISTAGKVALSALEIDGGTDIGADLADADLLIVDDAGGGTNRKTALTRLPTYVFSKVSGNATIASGGALTIANTAVTDGMLAGSISNAKLSNSTMTIGGVTLTLGGTDATPAFNLTDATAYPTSSLTGTITNAQLAGSVANDKLANSSVTVSDGNNSSAIALGGTLTFDGINFVESSGTVAIKSGGVDFAAFLPVPTMEYNTAANGSTTAFALANDITNAAWRNAAQVFRNGQLCKRVASGPSDSSEYTIASAASATTVTFGAAPLSNELLTFSYVSE
jgi:hypothetical protein|tara:strand:- start:363 stop:2027 length:1665 start_codon:yes stop_codon:yes gene_type:complete